MEWVMIIYKLPRSKTTAKKVAIWRKLKRQGVYPLQDSVCILPYSERNLEKFEWLAEEIKEMGGDATLWMSKGLGAGQEDRIKEYFLDQVNRQYAELINLSGEASSIKQLQALWTSFNRVKAMDYLRSPLWIEAKGALEKKALLLAGKDDCN